MITAAQLFDSPVARAKAKLGATAALGVLTPEQARQYAEATGRVTIICGMSTGNRGENRIVFFSDDHCFGGSVLPSSFVPCTNPIPYRPRFGDKEIITDPMDILKLHHDKDVLVTSVEELVNAINARM